MAENGILVFGSVTGRVLEHTAQVPERNEPLQKALLKLTICFYFTLVALEVLMTAYYCFLNRDYLDVGWLGCAQLTFVLRSEWSRWHYTGLF